MFYLIIYRDIFSQFYDCSCFFNSGATRSFVPLALTTLSFVSLALKKKFSDAPRTLDYPMEIVDDRSMSASGVYRGCVLNMFSERYLIDLVPIALRRYKVIMCMDRLGPNKSMIDYEHYLVRVRIPSEGELVVCGECAQHGPTVYSTERARRFLQHGCSRFLAYVVDMHVVGKNTMDDVPIVQEFPNVFPKDLSGCFLRGRLSFRLI